MPGVVGKGPPSSAANFAAAARVLFESAQKAGAVRPLGKHGRQYTNELTRLQEQSRQQPPRRGGVVVGGGRGDVFDGVSRKIAEFLAAQRTSAPTAAATSTTAATTTTTVTTTATTKPKTVRSGVSRVTTATLAPQPALDIPLFRAPPQPSPPAARVQQPKTPPTTSTTQTPTLTTTQHDTRVRDVAADATAAATATATDTTNTTTGAADADAKPKRATATATAAATSLMSGIHLVDDEPLFDANTPVDLVGAAPPAGEMTATATATATASSARKPVLVVPKTLTSSTPATTTTTPPARAKPVVMPVNAASAAAAAAVVAAAAALSRQQQAQDDRNSLSSSAAGAHDTPPLTLEVPSVDAWEQQRERELARLQQLRDAEEQQRLALLRAEEHRTLGLQWVQQRSRVLNILARPTSEEAKLLYSVQTAPSVQGGIAELEKLIALGARATPLLGCAFASIVFQLRTLAPTAQSTALTQLLALLEHDKVPRDVAQLLRLRLYAVRDDDEDALLATYRAVPEAMRRGLDAVVAARTAAALTRLGSWQEALALAHECEAHFSRAGKEMMAYRLLGSTRGLDEAARGEVLRYAAQQLRSHDDGPRSVTAQLALARGETVGRRRSMLQQLTRAADADERVYAELILCEDAGSVPPLLQEMQTRGLNCDDPAVLRATVLRILYDHVNNNNTGNSGSTGGGSGSSDNPAAEVFDELQSQMSKIGLRPMHVDVALRAVQMHPGNEACLRAALAVVKRVPIAHAGPPLQQLMPMLYSANMTSELVDVYDHVRTALTSADDAGDTARMPTVPQLLSTSCAFVNDALRAVGREPASALTVSDIADTVHAAGAATTTSATAAAPAGAASATAATARRPLRANAATAAAAAAAAAAGTVASSSAVHVQCDLAALTERMLAYTKSRDWAAALQAVQQQMHGVRADDNAAAVTLVYNCALGAAVEQPDVVMRVHALMQQRGVPANATTVNTILSSLSKAGRWQEAVAFASGVPHASKDNNTYLMHLSLLGQHDLWEQVVSVFDDMRSKVRKPPPALFTVAIAVASKHSWQATWRLYEDMVKLHGTAASGGSSIKEAVTSQVVRCLERHGRSAELARLAELGKKSGGKKKKK